MVSTSPAQDFHPLRLAIPDSKVARNQLSGSYWNQASQSIEKSESKVSIKNQKNLKRFQATVKLKKHGRKLNVHLFRCDSILAEKGCQEEQIQMNGQANLINFRQKNSYIHSQRLRPYSFLSSIGDKNAFLRESGQGRPACKVPVKESALGLVPKHLQNEENDPLSTSIQSNFKIFSSLDVSKPIELQRYNLLNQNALNMNASQLSHRRQRSFIISSAQGQRSLRKSQARG